MAKGGGAMYQRILLMDDGSELSRRAVPHAAALASVAGAGGAGVANLTYP